LSTPNSATDWFSYTFGETEYLFITIKNATIFYVVPAVSGLTHMSVLNIWMMYLTYISHGYDVLQFWKESYHPSNVDIWAFIWGINVKFPFILITKLRYTVRRPQICLTNIVCKWIVYKLAVNCRQMMKKCFLVFKTKMKN
jgi:hypothetical protein